MKTYRMGGLSERPWLTWPLRIYLRRYYSGGQWITPTHWVKSPETAMRHHQMLFVEVLGTWRIEACIHSWGAEHAPKEHP